jgi:hypothetical protein
MLKKNGSRYFRPPDREIEVLKPHLYGAHASAHRMQNHSSHAAVIHETAAIHSSPLGALHHALASWAWVITKTFEGFTKERTLKFAAFSLVILGQWLIVMKAVPWGWASILGGFALYLPAALGVDTHLEVAAGALRWFTRPGSRFLFFMTGWVLLGLGFLSYPNFQYVLSKGFSYPLNQSLWLIGLGALVLFVSAMHLPEPANPKEIGSLTSKIILAVILLLAAFLRFHRPLDPPGSYWDDMAMEIIYGRNVLDFGEHYWIFPSGGSEAFFAYFSALVWIFQPDASGLYVQRLSTTLINLITLWVFYLLGKEVSGRKAGLLMAALGALTQPFILMGIYWMRILSLSLAVSLCLLAFFKAARKPSLAHFLWFGAALGFGYFTYTPFRPMVPFFAVCLLLTVLNRPEERKGGWTRWLFLATSTAACAYLFLKVNGVLNSQNAALVLLSTPWVESLAVIGLFLLFVPVLKRVLDSHQGRLSLYCLGAFLLSQLLSHPTNRGEITQKLGNLFQDINQTGVAAMALSCLQRFALSVQTLFIGGPNRGDQGFLGDAFFDFPTVCVLVMGIIFAAARPDWKKVFLVLAAVVGMAPWFLTRTDPESGKLMGCIPPLFLLSALALNRLLDSLGTLRWGAILQRQAVILLAVLACLGASLNFHKIYDRWAFNPQFAMCNAWVARQTAQDGASNRVYMSKARESFTTGAGQDVLQDGRETFLLQGSNPIFLANREKTRNVVAILAKDDNVSRQLIQKDFPNAKWRDVLRPSGQAAQDAPLIGKVLIPSDMIPETPGKFFYIQRQSFPGWKRQYYNGHYGLARGPIEYEDRVEKLGVPSPAPLEGRVTCRVSGFYEAGSDGQVVFSTETRNYVRLKVDGKKLIDLKPSNDRASGITRSVNLGKGKHRVEIIVYFQGEYTVSPIRVTSSDGRAVEL